METVGRYEVLHKLGTGGMAEVLLGRTTGEGGFEKLVAIKRILPGMAENESFVKMFIDEATISARLNHSSIGQIFEFGKAADSYFIAMEYIQGVDLRAIHRVFRKQNRPPVPELGAFIMMHVCAALEYAHTKTDTDGKPLNIIHRDLSPSNVLVSFEGEVKLIDFGIAKAAQRLYVTVGANLKGKYAYMSPEQAFGRPVDHRSDIFGAGTLLFELLTGRNPFRADTDLATLQRVQEARVPAPSRVVRGVDPELDRICLRALAQRVEDRYPSAGEMQEDLEVFSKRSAFGGRRAAAWMKEAFAEEIETTQRTLAQARQQARAPGLRIVSTDELRQIGAVPEPARVVAPVAEAVPIEVTPVPMARAAAHVAATPTGPPDPRVRRSDPSERRIATVPPGGGMVPADDLTLMPEAPPLRRRSNFGVHAVVFLLIVVAVAAGVYLALGRKVLSPAPSAAPRGGVTLTIDPPFPAEVYVDDALHGTLSTAQEYTVSGLLPGRHRFKVMGDLILPVEQIVHVVEGQTTKMQMRVQPRVQEAR